MQRLGLDEALHVAVGEVDVATEGNLIGMHVVGAVVKAQARKSREALICGWRHEGIHSRKGRGSGGDIHGQRSSDGGGCSHVAVHVAIHVARLGEVDRVGERGDLGMAGGAGRVHVVDSIHGAEVGRRVLCAGGRQGWRRTGGGGSGGGSHVGSALVVDGRVAGGGGVILGDDMVELLARRGYGHAAAAMFGGSWAGVGCRGYRGGYRVVVVVDVGEGESESEVRFWAGGRGWRPLHTDAV